MGNNFEKVAHRDPKDTERKGTHGGVTGVAIRMHTTSRYLRNELYRMDALLLLWSGRVEEERPEEATSLFAARVPPQGLGARPLQRAPPHRRPREHLRGLSF